MKRRKSEEQKAHFNTILKKLWARKSDPEIAITYFMKSPTWYFCIVKSPSPYGPFFEQVMGVRRR